MTNKKSTTYSERIGFKDEDLKTPVNKNQRIRKTIWIPRD